MPPGRLLKPRLRLQAAMSETHSCAGITPFGGRIWTFVNNAG